MTIAEFGLKRGVIIELDSACTCTCMCRKQQGNDDATELIKP